MADSCMTHTKKLDRAIDAAYAELMTDVSCQFCGGKDGHEELIHTGDNESLGGYEIWFCCHKCRDKGEPCETYTQLPIPEEFK